MGVQTNIQKEQQNKQQNKMPETRVPMTLRDHFLQDPFFKSAWEDMEAFRGGFRRDSQSSKMIESSEKKEERKEEKDSRIGMFGRYLVPRKWMMPSLLEGEESLKLSDSGVINRVDDDTKLELSLNTAGYKPSELSVNVTDGQLIVEGKHHVPRYCRQNAEGDHRSCPIHHQDQDHRSPREEVLRLDRRIHPGLPLHLPADVDLQAGV